MFELHSDIGKVGDQLFPSVSVFDRLRSIGRLALLQLELRRVSIFWWMVLVVEPVVLLGLVALGLKPSSVQQQTMLVLAVGLSGMWASVLFTSGWDIERERVMGTLEGLVGAPKKLYSIMLIKSMVNALFGLIPLAFSVVLAYSVFGWRVAAMDYVLFFVSLLGAVFSMGAAGVLVCGLFAVSRSARGYANALHQFVVITSGIWIPVPSLGFPLQLCSWIFPPSWSVRAAMAAIQGDPIGWQFFIIGLILSALLLACGNALFRALETQSRSGGTLGLY